mmetsp:Transcript_29153/g.80053  ORF Transcript_29153/g.80053 Transcript_29153/m.80053 type:complete len:208 (+) Transcript_29153:1055-1678(+)
MNRMPTTVANGPSNVPKNQIVVDGHQDHEHTNGNASKHPGNQDAAARLARLGGVGTAVFRVIVDPTTRAQFVFAVNSQYGTDDGRHEGVNIANQVQPRFNCSTKSMFWHAGPNSEDVVDTERTIVKKGGKTELIPKTHGGAARVVSGRPHLLRRGAGYQKGLQHDLQRKDDIPYRHARQNAMIRTGAASLGHFTPNQRQQGAGSPKT